MPGRTPAGKRYAEAVAGITRADGAWERWRRDLDLAAGALSSPQLRQALESPGLRHQQKYALIEEVLGGKIAGPALNLLKVMARRGRIDLLPDVAKWFGEIADRALGVRRFQVTTAAPLVEEQRELLRQRLAEGSGSVVLTEHVDPSLLGGLVLRHGDVIHDYSVRSRLEALRARLN